MFTFKPNKDTSIMLRQLAKDGTPQYCTRMPATMQQNSLGTITPKLLPCIAECPLMIFGKINPNDKDKDYVVLTCSPTSKMFPINTKK